MTINLQHFKFARGILTALVSLLCLQVTLNAQTPNTPEKPRIVVTADPELDDNNSLIRFLLYSTDMDIVGLVYASSGFHWKGDGNGTKWFVPGREYDRFQMDECPCESWRWAEDERFIHEVVEAYEKVYPNLKVHHTDYPTPEYLKSIIRYGNVEFDGDFSKDTPGSDLIKELILDNEPGKLFITAWGGASTIARALKSIEDHYKNTQQWSAIKEKIARKVVLLPSGDQDDTYAKYIKPHWPEIEYRQFSNSPNYGYGAQFNALPENAKLLTSDWMQENISAKGPLGEQYRVWGDGKQMVRGDKVDYFGFEGYTDEQLKKMGYKVWMPVQPKGSWLGEGDNHTFMNMLGNGLRAFEDGTFGGWGGRTDPTELAEIISFSGGGDADALASQLGNQDNSSKTEYPNFFPMAQHDFATRMHWSVTPKYKDANHEPVVEILGPMNLLVNPGQKVPLFGKVTDPDGDKTTVKWWQFQVGTYPNQIQISRADTLHPEIEIPKDAKSGQTIHIILEATDSGSPSLTRYQRIVISIK